MADGQDDDHHDRTTGGPGQLSAPAEREGEQEAGAPVARHAGWWKVARRVTVGLSVAVLLAASAGAFVYLRLNGSLRELPLFGGIGGNAGSERPDAFGRTPLNVLVIGSDARSGRADCRLGGDCGPGQNADVEMVLHIAADRSHATVLSIPRDTVTALPACRTAGGGIAAAHRGPVNSTLQYGPGCTVAAVHKLTALPIDHFVLADFAGVVRMSDAVGGVPVCVDRNVYDPYSHLKLAKGRHELKGDSALEFLRSRHAFGDGSDLGRTDAQHLFLGALAHRMREGGAPAGPAGMLSLADAATTALTVDTALASVDKLSGLADDVRKVPSARFAFTTMPSRPDPADPNRLVPEPAAEGLFAAIGADRPLRVSGPPTAAGGHPRTARPGPPADETFEDRAAGGAGGRAGSPTASSARGRTAAGGGACAKVSTTASVTVNGVAMTPAAAYAATPRVPVSAW
ncbi:LCP family protein [Actinacidiphila sp. ITFR-21]|uniref:LCP family protein n=1 Tax=Actinacidiphila sp. ITFR-21 TaxID=3075199 RepID=UPI00288AACD2|nr:LCP family protein [Streptomyces sp. ITFR-21]WNI19299.1 LCP family protein [Streptomyces sp. ITFR-21]